MELSWLNNYTKVIGFIKSSQEIDGRILNHVHIV